MFDAITFFVIQAYTIYFWKVAGHLGPVFGTFLAGAVTLGALLYSELFTDDPNPEKTFESKAVGPSFIFLQAKAKL